MDLSFSFCRFNKKLARLENQVGTQMFSSFSNHKMSENSPYTLNYRIIDSNVADMRLKTCYVFIFYFIGNIY